jgi:HEPN superfamily RiboL-PSP-like protein
MPLSRRLRQVLRRLDVLEKHLLPPEFSLTGSYPAKQRDHTKAYLLLVHAELEAYFEDCARNRVNLAHERWRRKGQCTPVLSRLLVFYHATEKDELGALSTQAVTKAVHYYVDRLDKNHGIKEKHLLSIFLPLGISHGELDSQLVSACNQLAQKRNQFAHASFKTHQPVDPKGERDNIRRNIIPELKKFDARLKRL